MNSSDIRRRFLAFFEKRGHAVIPSASLVTSDERGITNPTLFNTAGMQPLIPYLLGEPHPSGKRLAGVQKCLRTIDIDDIGDATHATFFEMLGNWSLGDYFKKEAIGWSYEFLTDKKEGLGLDPKRLYVTVFEGDDNAPEDEEAAGIWKEVFEKGGIASDGRIFYLPADKNWWEAGDNGPCGPDTEMYYDVSDTFSGRELTHEEFIKADSEGKVVEVWNDVFMLYEKKDGKIIGKLAKPSVDTGAGLERLAMVMQGVDSIYGTDIFNPLLEKLKKGGESGYYNEKSARIILDHTRAATFLISDGVIPSNTDRGYVLRKLIRRATDHAREFNLSGNPLYDISRDFIDFYADIYSGLDASLVEKILSAEVSLYTEALRKGIQKIIQTPNLKSESVEHQAIFIFDLYQSVGLPVDVAIAELAKHQGLKVSDEVRGLIAKSIDQHQSLSRSGAEKKFKGGLADANDEMVVRYHTATHLLHQALHDVLGDGVSQKGSNITAERLRFDFANGAKMTDEEKKRVEDIVNEKIQAGIPMNQVTLPREEAERTGARHSFNEKYGDQISVYFIGQDLNSAYSKEFCGGPHVKNTKELSGPEGKWKFKIQKEEAVAQGIRRIKAILG